MEYPKKKKRGSPPVTKLLLVLVILLSCAGLVYVAVIRPAAESFTLGETITLSGDESRQNIEQVTGAPLPESAFALAFHGVRWMDYAYWMRIAMAAEDFDAWLDSASNLCFALLEANGIRGVSGNNPELLWWTPDAAKTYLSADQCGSSPYYNILVDTTDAQTWTVYLYVFST